MRRRRIGDVELPTVESASATVSARRTLVRARFCGPAQHRGPPEDHQEWVTTAHPAIPQARIDDTATHKECQKGEEMAVKDNLKQRSNRAREAAGKKKEEIKEAVRDAEVAADAVELS
jgi:hypothetical protein